MSGQVFYKFASSQNFDSVHFQGDHIHPSILKREIMKQKKLDSNKKIDFEFIFQNFQTKEEFNDKNIPKNSSVLVKRVPLSFPNLKIIQEIPQNSDVIHVSNLNTVVTKGSLKISEDDRISNLIQTSSILPKLHLEKSIYQNGSSIPPPDYICHRCGCRGHYINRCPTNFDKKFDKKVEKKFTGIPKSQQSKFTNKEKENTKKQVQSSSSKEDIPEKFKCKLCQKVMKSSVKVDCCSSNFCDECVTETIVNITKFKCPSCNKKLFLDDIISDHSIRNEINQYQNKFKRSLSSNDFFVSNKRIKL
eukprot:gene9081-1176_t